MRRISVRIGLPLLALTLLAAPAAAEIYHLKLHNGAVLDTLYPPQPASWDANVLLVLSDAGNWIGISKNDVESITNETQVRGYGIPINTTTVAIGWAPNDLAEQAPAAQQGQAAGQQAALQVLQRIYQEQQKQEHYTVQQGVQSEQAQGIPPSLISPYRSPVPQVPASMPTPVPLSMPPG
ncbi:MAG TPA: hypothetical protein VHQ90_07550 [Thermoanaerobaculia bacterium]|nr:hypothetical protein [Thermoanaerobaculia bacterium]